MNLFTVSLICIFARAQVGAQYEPYYLNCSSITVPPNYDHSWTCMNGPCKDQSFSQKRNTNTNSPYFCNFYDRSMVCCMESASKTNQNNKGKSTTVLPLPNDRYTKKPNNKNFSPRTTQSFLSTSTISPTTNEPASSDDIAVDPLVQKLQAKKFNKFDLNLLSELSKSDENRGKNIIVSPASVKTLLALLVEGSSGSTTDEILQALQLQTMDKQESMSLLRKSYSLLKNNRSVVTLESGNKIYRAYGLNIRKDYESIVKNAYDVDIESLDFSNSKLAAATMNEWVDDVSHGLIPNLVDADNIEKDTKLFLLNFIYLKANWDQQFDVRSTYTHCFYERENDCQKIKFMHQKRLTNYTDSGDHKAEIFEIPFRDPRYTIVFMIPHAGTNVQSVLANLDRKDLFEQMKSFEEEEINLSLPRTAVEFSNHLVDTLKKLNIRAIFGNEAKLDNLLNNNTPLFVDDIIHKARIEFTEEGAEAAAISGGNTMTLSADTDRNVIADRPFLFFLRDTTVAGFLFEGIVSSPDRAK